MKYSHVIWDIDGTLLNTREGVISSVEYTLDYLGYSKENAEKTITFPKIKDAFIQLYNMNDEQAQLATDLFRDRYKEFDLFKAVPYDGIYDVMKYLQENGVKQAIATNKRQDYATKICVQFDFDEYCHPIYGTDKDGKLTKDKLILACLTCFSEKNQKIIPVMIGDTVGDKDAAEKVGIDFIGVNYGFGFQNIDGYALLPNDLREMLK